MAKRRTKAQKAHASARRASQLARLFRPVTTANKASAKKSAIKTANASALSSSPPAHRHDYRALDLRRSLVLLGLLVSLEAIIWLVFRSSVLDDKLYNWIKL